MTTYADDRRIDQFCHDLAIALRRISGKSTEIDSQDMPTDSGARNDVNIASALFASEIGLAQDK